MEQGKLDECVDRIVDCSNEVSGALEGLRMLHGQGETIVMRMDNSEGQTITRDELHEHMTKLYTLLDLVKITLNHAQDHNRFLQEATYEIQREGHKDLSVIQGGAV